MKGVHDQQVKDARKTYIESMCNLDVDSEPLRERLCGIVCTVGPSSNKEDTLYKMMSAGMNIARLNFAHGTQDLHSDAIEKIRSAAQRFGRNCAIAIDTKGPLARTGYLKEGYEDGIRFKEGDYVFLTTDLKYKNECDNEHIWVNDEHIVEKVNIGGVIFLDSGIISLKIVAIFEHGLKGEINNDGILLNNKTCHIESHDCCDLDIEADKSDILFGVNNDIDIIFLSFTSNAQDIVKVRNLIGESGKNIKIIAKIETSLGLKNFNSILNEADGIMVSRGVLGMEIPIEKVIIAQKKMIGWCNRVGKSVICATQMLESMVKNARPTRAETTDVANAILDGADCLMLSAETAVGLYPVESVQTMANIAKEAEAVAYHHSIFEDLRVLTSLPFSLDRANAMAAVDASISNMAKGIFVLTTSGKSARMVASYRPKCAVIAITRDGRVARQLHLYKGVFPIHYSDDTERDWIDGIDAMLAYAIQISLDQSFTVPGCNAVVVNCWSKGSIHSNTLRMIKIPDYAQIENLCVLGREKNHLYSPPRPLTCS